MNQRVRRPLVRRFIMSNGKTNRITNIVAFAVVIIAILATMVVLRWVGVEDVTATVTSIVGGAVTLAAILLGKAGMKPKIILLVFGLLFVSGCGPLTSASINNDGISSNDQPQNQAEMDAEGVQRAQYVGIAPTHLKQDGAGSWLTTPGIGAVVTVEPETGRAYIWSPKDVSIDSLQLPDGMSVKGLTANASKVIGAWDEQAIAFATTLRGMSADRREVAITRAVEAGKITPEVGDVLRSIIPIFMP